MNTLLTLRLPIGVGDLSHVNELVEHVYGTGALMRADGDHIHILEPDEGLGERIRGDRASTEPSASAIRARYFELRDGKATLTLEDEEHTLLLIAEVLRRWFEDAGGINYVETTLATGKAEPDFILTLQRRDGLTPADKAAAAEARVAAIAEYMNSPVPGNDFYLGGFDSRWDHLAEMYSDTFVRELRALVDEA